MKQVLQKIFKLCNPALLKVLLQKTGNFFRVAGIIVSNSFSMAWNGVISQRARSFLTMLGIVIGIAAVISLMSIGKGAEADILSRIQTLGSNLITIRAGAAFNPGGVRSAQGSSTRLTVEDATALTNEVQYVSAVAPVNTSNMQLIVGGNNSNNQVTGTTPSYMMAYNLSTSSGSFFSQSDYDRGAMVVVLGSNVAQTLFKEDNPVGKDLRMGSIILTVSGVLVSKGSTMGSTDDGIFIPLTTMQKAISQAMTARGERVISSISLTVSDEKQTDYVMSEITRVLRARHRLAADAENDFQVSSMQDIAETLAQTMGTMTIFLGAIAAISLVVGGIGVMNIMLVSVLERTREIGIRRAIGAKSQDIWTQFLIEASLLSLAGGLIGVGAGYGISNLIAQLGIMKTLVSVDTVIMAVCVSAGIGLVFGFYPAWRATRLSPIEALRHE